MNLQEVEKKVAGAVREFFSLDQEPACDTTLVSLGCDSLDAVELTLELEDHFPEVGLAAFVAEQAMSIADIAAEITKYAGKT